MGVSRMERHVSTWHVVALVVLLALASFPTFAQPKITRLSEAFDRYTFIRGISTTYDGSLVSYHANREQFWSEFSHPATQVYVTAADSNESQIVSLNSQSEQANATSLSSSMSDDGRYVVFVSRAQNLSESEIPPGSNFEIGNVYIRDRNTGVTSQVFKTLGPENNSKATRVDISGNGRFVVVVSDSRDLVPNDVGENTSGVYLHDRETNVTQRVDVSETGAVANDSSFFAQVSDNGRVMFISRATNLVDSDEVTTLFIKDVPTGKTRVLGAPNSSVNGYPAISKNGASAIYVSNASELFLADLRDLDAISYRVVNAQAATGYSRHQLSNDGRYILFQTIQAGLTFDDAGNPNPSGLYRYDSELDQFFFVTDRETYEYAMSGSGKVVWYVTEDNYRFNRLYQVDEFGQVKVFAPPLSRSLNGASHSGGVSEDGRAYTYQTTATNTGLSDLSGFRNRPPTALYYDALGQLQKLFADGGVITANGNKIVRDGRVSDFQNLIADREFFPSLTSFAPNSGVECAVPSQDAQIVAFRSDNPDLVSDDTNDNWDVFVAIASDDYTPATIERVSVKSSGAEALGESLCPDISLDGRFVVFASWSGTLVAGDNNGKRDVFLHDRQTGATTLISKAMDGGAANGHSHSPRISADGSTVVFRSSATNLIDDDTNSVDDVFVYRIDTQTTSRVSVSTAGAQANQFSSQPDVSGDGTQIVFSSAANNLIDVDDNSRIDVFIHNSNSNQTSVIKTFQGLLGDSNSLNPTITNNGRYVVFESEASNFVAGDDNGVKDVFLVDLIGLADADGDGLLNFEELSLDSDGDGVLDFEDTDSDNDGLEDRVEGFADSDGDDIPNFRDRDSDNDGLSDESETHQVGLADFDGDGLPNHLDPDSNNDGIRDGQYVSPLERINKPDRAVGAASDAGSHESLRLNAISRDGRYILFESEAPGMVINHPNDTEQGNRQIYLRDRLTDRLRRVSVNNAGEQGIGDSFGSHISADGQFVVFLSTAENLVADGNGEMDAFLYDMRTKTTRAISVDPDGNTVGAFGAPGEAYFDADGELFISDDSSFVVFRSSSDRLVPGHDPAQSNTYLFNRLTEEIVPFVGDGGLKDIDTSGNFVLRGTNLVDVATQSIEELSSFIDLGPLDSMYFLQGVSVSQDGRNVLLVTSTESFLQDRRILLNDQREPMDVFTTTDGRPLSSFIFPFPLNRDTLSDDGRFVAIEGSRTVYINDLVKHETRSASGSLVGDTIGSTRLPRISGDGSTVVFEASGRRAGSPKDIFARQIVLDEDQDLDGIVNVFDNCPTVWNPTQDKLNGEDPGPGDACNPEYFGAIDYIEDLNGNGVPDIVSARSLRNERGEYIHAAEFFDGLTGERIHYGVGFFGATERRANKLLGWRDPASASPVVALSSIGFQGTSPLAMDAMLFPSVQARFPEDSAVAANLSPWGVEWTPKDVSVLKDTSLGSGQVLLTLATNRHGLSRLEVRDIASRQVLARHTILGFGWDMREQGTLTVDGEAALAVLATRASDGLTLVQVRRVSDGQLIRNVYPLGPGWTPREMKVLPDMNQNGADEVAVRMVRKADGLMVVQIRDGETNALVSNVYPIGAGNGDWHVRQFESLLVHGQRRLAILATHIASQQVLVQIKNPLSGAVERNLYYLPPPRELRDNMLIIPDYTGDNSDEIAVPMYSEELGRLIQVRNSGDGTVIRNTFPSR